MGMKLYKQLKYKAGIMSSSDFGKPGFLQPIKYEKEAINLLSLVMSCFLFLKNNACHPWSWENTELEGLERNWDNFLGFITTVMERGFLT